MFCHKCGNKMEKNVKFCLKCGAELNTIDVTGMSQDKKMPAIPIIAGAIIVALAILVTIFFASDSEPIANLRNQLFGGDNSENEMLSTESEIQSYDEDLGEDLEDVAEQSEAQLLDDESDIIYESLQTDSENTDERNSTETTIDISNWITLEIETGHISIPPTWDWESDGGVLGIWVFSGYGAEGTISLSLNGMEANTTLANAAQSSQAFIFDDGHVGVMLDLGYSIRWIRSDSWQNLGFFYGEDITLFHANEQLLTAIARSFSFFEWEQNDFGFSQEEILHTLFQCLTQDWWYDLIIFWEDGRQTLFYSYDSAREMFWWMVSRDGNEREVFPTVAFHENFVEIGFPQTTTRLYHLFADGSGIFGDEIFYWSFKSWNCGVELFW